MRMNKNILKSGGEAERFFYFDGARESLLEIEEKFGISIADVRQITLAGNNGVFILNDDCEDRFVIKFYRKDERNRLDREFRACTFLKENKFSVPQALVRNNDFNFGVYSFEYGERRLAVDLPEDEILKMVDFVVHLQDFASNKIKERFDIGVYAALSSHEVLSKSIFRVQKIEEAMHQGKLHRKVSGFLKTSGMLEEVSRLSRVRMKKWIDMSWKIKKKDQRLSPRDFGVHNALFRENEEPCIVDFENFGWDDPLECVVNFVNHDTSLDLSSEAKNRIVSYYAERMSLSEKEKQRLDLLRDMSSIRWIAIYLQSLTLKYLESRKFSSAGEFNTEEYVERQISRARLRYNEIVGNRELKTMQWGEKNF